MIDELRGEVQAAVMLIRKDAIEVRTSTMKVPANIIARLDRTKNTMLSAVVSNEAAPLLTKFIVIMKARKALSNEMKLRFSRVNNWLAIAK